MRYFIMFLTITLITLCACGDNEPDVVYIILVQPKIDCDEYLLQLGADFSRRGLSDSSIAKEFAVKARSDCEEENKRRGY